MTYASGELVAAQWRDNRWYRARVLESDVRKDVESSSVRVRLQRVHIRILSLHDVIMLACVTWCVAGVFRRFWQHYLGERERDTTDAKSLPPTSVPSDRMSTSAPAQI